MPQIFFKVNVHTRMHVCAYPHTTLVLEQNFYFARSQPIQNHKNLKNEFPVLSICPKLVKYFFPTSKSSWFKKFFSYSIISGPII